MSILLGNAPANKIASNGLVWTFSGNLAAGTYGRFVTGDWWVVGPVTVNSADPAWTGAMNGSMVNPDPAGTTQGYDNRASAGFTYAAGVRTTFPVDLVAGDSLISVISRDPLTGGSGASRVNKAAVLTVLASAPASAAFRPPYVAGSKPLWLTSQVDYTILPGLAVPSGCTPISMSSQTTYGARVLLHHGNLQTYHVEVMPTKHTLDTTLTAGYPHEVALEYGRMALHCLTAAADAQVIANRLIQLGIDLYACASSNGDTWSRQAGYGLGRKWPILFAGIMLNDAGMKAPPYYVIGSSGQLKFQEDSHTYLGDASTPRWGDDCDITDGTFGTSNHTCRSTDGTQDQYATSSSGQYDLTTSNAFIGPALAARLLEASEGAQTLWGHTPFFSYTDRWVDTIAAAGGVNLGSDFAIDANKYGGNGGLFMKRMWETYR